MITASEFQGRARIELLATAHAAARPSRALNGRVEVLLDEDIGNQGVAHKSVL